MLITNLRAAWFPAAASLILFGLAIVLLFRLVEGGQIGIDWIFKDHRYTYTVTSFVFIIFNTVIAYLSRGVFCFVILIEAIALLSLWGSTTVLVVVPTFLSFALFGYFIMKRLGVGSAYYQDIFLSLAVGLVTSGWIMQGVSFLPIHNAFFYSLLLVSALLLGRNVALAWFRSGVRQFVYWYGHSCRNGRVVVSVAVSAILVFGYVTHIPEVGTDALMTHLAVTTQIVKDSRFIPDIETLSWAYIPKPMHFAYLPVHILAGEYGLRLFHASFLILAVLAVGAGIARAGSPHAGWIMVAFLIGSPLALQESASIFVENYLSFISVAAVLALIRTWKRGFARRDSVLGGLLFGGIAAAKFHGIVFAPLIALIFAAGVVRARFAIASLVSCAAAGLTYIVVAAPSYVIPWVATGNPLFPYFNQIFRSPYFSTEPYNFPFERPPVDITLWLEMAVDGAPFLEAGGPVSMFQIYFFAPVVLLGLFVLRRPEFVIPALLGIGHVVLVISVQNYLRYHTPGFFTLSIAAGLAMASLWAHILSRTAVCVAGAIIVIANAIFAVKGNYQYIGVKAWELPTRTGQTQLERWRAPEREMVKTADTLLDSRERFAIFWYPYVGFAKADALPVHPLFGHASWEDFQSAMAAGDPVPFFNKYGVTHVIMRHDARFTAADSLLLWLKGHSFVAKSNNGAALYSISPDVLFNQTVVGQNFPDGWEISGSPRELGHRGLIISESNLALKPFDASGGSIFQMRLTASCLRGSTVWLHINWYDASGSLLHVDIANRGCTADRSTYRAFFEAPAGTSRGSVVLDAPPNGVIEVAEITLSRRPGIQ